MRLIRNIKLGLLALLIVFTGCQKEEFGSMAVRMTDAPADYDAVYVDVQKVELHYESADNGHTGWYTMDAEAGIYDLLKLQNDVSVMIAEEEQLPAGTISQMRLVLGDRNSVVRGFVSNKLIVPSGLQTGIKINFNTFIEGGEEYDVLIDFDAEKSIVINGKGEYILQPVITIESVTEV